MTLRGLVGLLVVVGGPRLVEAQGTGGVVGIVRDTSGSVLASAVASIGASRATTGADGTFRLENVATGSHQLTVIRVGFQATRRSIRVEEGRETRIDVTLTPAIVELLNVTLAPEIRVIARPEPGSVSSAPDLANSMLLAGVKSEYVRVASMDANLAEKTPRQLFARVPGIFVYDMDGTGNQVNISTRGLDAHRSWEMNVRQDGVVVNSDLYGYPAAHYSPPLEAMETLELVRGTAALQYGSQFGGLVNYRTKAADTTRRVAFESISSAGSYGLLGTWNSVSGRVGPLTYRAYASGRQSDGYRSSSESRASSQYLGVDYRVNDKVDVRGQVGRSWYRYQIPGALTDAMFDADPRAATRSRNWFSPDIVVPSVAVTWRPNWRTRVHAQLSAVLGDRSSVQFVGFADVRDTVQTATGTYLPRQVDIDGFQSVTGELRVSHEYRLGELPWVLAAGIAINDNDLHRRQQGRGTTGTGYDLALSSGTFGRDIHYLTNNVALYAEQLIPVTRQFSVIPGVRIERGETRMRGRLSYLDPAQVPTNIEHNYPLFGIRAEWQVANAEVYGGWSQSYRPMILKDVIPETAIERTDPNLRDARGWTIEGGVRGMAGHVRYDVSAFALRYNNRFGGILQVDSAGASYLFKTNVGSSLTRGIELALEAPLVVTRIGTLRAHTASSYFDGTYRRGTVTSAGQNLDITGNRIEAVPKWISRTGLTAGGSTTSATLLVSYTSDSYADPQNTLVPSANGARGLVPSYTIVDVNASRQLAPWVRVRVGVSNVFDADYFTKRPTFYPGPGIWPSDGRGVNASVELSR